MIGASIYSLLLLGLLIYVYTKKRNIISILLVGYYFFISVMSIFAGCSGVIDLSTTSVFFYIYLFLIELLFFLPLFLSKQSINYRIANISTDKYKLFAYIYIICSIVTIKCYFLPVSKLIISGQWAIQRDIFYGKYAETLTYPYGNFFEYVCMLFPIYFSLLGYLVGFLMLIEKKNFKLGLLLISVNVIAQVFSSLYTVSRGAIYDLTIFLIILFIFFSAKLDIKRKVFFEILFGIGLVAIFPYIVSITQSRFSSDSISELFRYFGEAPYVFNTSVASADKCALGKYFFSGLFDTGYNQTSIGASYGSRFYTFVGYLFIDWGLIGTIFVSVSICLLMYKILRKRKYRIYDIFLILFYYQTLLNGAFVLGKNYIKMLLASLFIYIMLKYIYEPMNIKLPKFKVKQNYLIKR